MYSDSPQGAPATDRPSSSVAHDDLLPPVEPPSAGFIVQLFVVPAVIVAAVVLLWVAINWLASPGRQDPAAILSGLRASGPARFQQAEELASMLRMEASYPELKTNKELARGLAELLDGHVAAAVESVDDDSEDAIRMRMFLAASLGEFHVDEPVGSLLNAAANDPNGHGRRGAIGALAVLAGWFGEQEPPVAVSHPKLASTFARLTASDEALDRSTAAFTLGVLTAVPQSDPELFDMLLELSEDFYFDARYNGAIGLARNGDPRAAPVLVEMLDLEQIEASVASEQAVNPNVSGPAAPPAVVASLRAEKRDAILKNALAAVQMLVDRKVASQAPQLKAAVAKLIAEAPEVRDPRPIPTSLITAAQRVAAEL